jgi:2-(1,2-epoxy-1,2-dihydrophenyl)acetyl-CoA isomerase
MSPLIIAAGDPATHIGTITINRADKRNAFTRHMVRQFIAALDRFEHDDAIKVILIRGEGRHLSAGLDVGEAARLYEREDLSDTRIPSQRARFAAHHELWWGAQGLWHRLVHCRKITVAAAHGNCYGAGFNLCLYSDLVLASETARFAQPRWAHVGVDGDIAMLIAAVGLRRARELMFLAATWDAQQACKYGLIDGVVPARKLPAAVEGMARACAMIMRDGIAAEKQVVLASLARLQVDFGFAAAGVLGGWASNILHRPGEFNFLRELRREGPRKAMRSSNRHFGRT